MARLNLPKTTTWEYLAKLRVEGFVESVGKGRGARWVLIERGAEQAAALDLSRDA